jgi:hypothetical protein
LKKIAAIHVISTLLEVSVISSRIIKFGFLI